MTYHRYFPLKYAVQYIGPLYIPGQRVYVDREYRIEMEENIFQTNSSCFMQLFGYADSQFIISLYIYNIYLR